MIWIHPVLGASAVILLVWLGAQGLRSRHKRSYAAQARTRHRKVSRWAFVLLVTAAIAGTASVYFLRSDLRPTGSFHFWLGWGACLLAGALAWSGPQVPTDPDAKQLHPLFGGLAMITAVIAATLGLGLLP